MTTLFFMLALLRLAGQCVILYMYDYFLTEISYSKVRFTLNQLSFILLVVALSCTFVAQKYQNARHRAKSVVTSFCSRVASDIPRLAVTCHSMLVVVIHALRNLCGSAL